MERGSIILRKDIYLEKHKQIKSLFPKELNPDNLDSGFREIVVVNVDRISSSCGYSIPMYEYASERETL